MVCTKNYDIGFIEVQTFLSNCIGHFFRTTFASNLQCSWAFYPRLHGKQWGLGLLLI